MSIGSPRRSATRRPARAPHRWPNTTISSTNANDASHPEPCGKVVAMTGPTAAACAAAPTSATGPSDAAQIPVSGSQPVGARITTPPIAVGSTGRPVAASTGAPVASSTVFTGVAAPPVAAGVAAPPFAAGVAAAPPFAAGVAAPPVAAGVAAPPVAAGVAAPPVLSATGVAAPPVAAGVAAPPVLSATGVAAAARTAVGTFARPPVPVGHWLVPCLSHACG